MPTGYSLYPNQQQQQQPQNLHETFTARQRRLGSAPNGANRELYPQSSNHTLEGPTKQAPEDPSQQGAIQPLTPLTPATPTQRTPRTYAGYSPNVNIAAAPLMQKFKNAKWNTAKRDMTDAEKQGLAQWTGYGGGDLSQESYNKANWAIDHYTGDVNNPGVPDYDPWSDGPVDPANAAGPRPPKAAGWQGTPGWGVQTPGYVPDTASAPGTYNPFQFAQWQGMDDGATGNQMQGILDQILGSPEVLDAQTVNQMKTRSKESALAQNQQVMSGIGSDLAARGFGGGGMEAFGKIAANQQMNDALIDSFRDIDIGAKETNRASTLDALAAGDSFLNSRLARGSENFNNTMKGQAAQAAENQFGAGFNLDRFSKLEELAQKANDSTFRNNEFAYSQQKDDRDRRLQEFLAEEGVSLDRDKFNELKSQFKTATGLDLMKFLESKRQFDSSLGENRRQFDTGFGENQRQFNTTSGIDTAKLNLQGQQMLQQFLSSIYGG